VLGVLALKGAGVLREVGPAAAGASPEGGRSVLTGTGSVQLLVASALLAWRASRARRIEHQSL